MVRAPKIKLNDGNFMPAFGLGTYLSNGDEGELAVKHAIEAGYRHIDTAFLYDTEEEVGRAIRDKIAEGVIKRENVYIVTKLWCTFHEKEKVLEACKKSLKNLGLEYIDLYIIHFPIAFIYQGDADKFPKDSDGKRLVNDVDYLETWQGMEECVKQGLVRSIGVSNFNSEQIKRILSVATIKPANNQVECSPNINQKKLIQFCKEHDIVVTAYCPLGRPNSEKKTPNYLHDEKVAEIGKKYNKTPAQVILRYLFELGTVPLPKSVTNSRIQQNIDIFDFRLTDGEREYMDSFNTNSRIVEFTDLKDHKYYPFNAEY